MKKSSDFDRCAIILPLFAGRLAMLEVACGRAFGNSCGASVFDLLSDMALQFLADNCVESPTPNVRSFCASRCG
jgi:hypothetical protein